MRMARDFMELTGCTPIVRLRKASEETGCELFGKAEFLNPGGSVKDRAACFIINDALSKGMLEKGGLIVEGTAGNTGIGLALAAKSRGLRTLIVIPETQSCEKKTMLRQCGAELIEVPARPYKDERNYVRFAGRLAAERAETEPKGAIWANQFDNILNKQAHIEGSAAEIYQQTGGKIDGFVCSVGTGGTLAGIAEGLRARLKQSIKIGIADPHGAALYDWYTRGVLESSGDSIIEGIGQARITENLKGLEVDMAWRIPDSEAIKCMFELLEYEGLMLGGSSGLNVAGAIRMAREMGPGHTIMTILCDSGARYQSKLYNADFLKAKNLPMPDWLDSREPAVSLATIP